MNKLLSIIIPHFNCEVGLAKLLDSILCSLSEHQLEMIEIIVVDDNSLDENTFKSWKDNYPSVVFLSNNSGVRGAGAARNIGLKHVTGDYLLFADADDFLADDWFSIISEHLINNSYDVIYFSPACISLSGRKPTRHLRYVKLVHNFIENNDASIRYRFHVPWSKLISTKLVKDNGILFDEVIASNDVSFSLQVGSAANSIDCKANQIYVVTEGEGSLTTSKSIDKLLSRVHVLLKYNASLSSMGESQYCISPLPLIYEIIKINPTTGLSLFYNLVKSGNRVLHLNYFKRYVLSKVF
ncbi:hypothetical protein ABT57_03295 [Photobacterium ganghwense]|uniref:Glycosyltransferase 2-like domain-containing protein n=1 Tax=Photobacterium ganghwense TaxID=320778 RepID=A0A0J1HH48_9GAMM|nr:glycosyltransferase [Photobacterium ganghwense]KLV10946.1 hypothetical protein ABT57_03295 [Photobacterium ganghwense]QSV13327.1 glycosyltransferase family 2 protein [Photobacterium ganghwense]